MCCELVNVMKNVNEERAKHLKPRYHATVLLTLDEVEKSLHYAKEIVLNGLLFT